VSRCILIHTVAKPRVTVSVPWLQLKLVCYGFTQWSYGGDKVHAGIATVLPRNKPELFRSPVRPGYLKKIERWTEVLEVNAVLTRCIPIHCGACRWAGVRTVAMPGLKTRTS